MPGSNPIEYPFPDVPAAGAANEVARGVHWVRMVLPFQLDHINLWLLEDRAGGAPAWTLVDTGLGKIGRAHV